ncbi:rab11 family-interacting protein 1 isoform X2 [Haemorhous mexicanus]|uniref:rab11 family-interacting protein 1 isoform X2 n=1 Tax=Haemorhous mexicanus TaxID=30427 RepID=UPI0028BE8953|nr:rab11 family-interacting protein 1 isoform X2 [Haemorhous mexicanus]
MAGTAPGWAPTHVRVTVLRARGLRAKAAAGGSDAYAVMALGRDKFRTSVAERCRGEPLWREEATFELPARPAALRLTVLHRALAGADKFLGRAEVELAALREDGGRQHTRWYKLRSKPGKKEKERGEIEVDIQFMRSNMTASMFDLSMKDKPRSPFGKLKDKLKGKRSSGLSDTASAIVPSTSHSPADSEDEAVEKEKKKSKFKALFSKPGLQKTSLSQSMSVLPTQQPLTQRVRLRPSDFQAQWDEEESETSPASERSFENVPEQKPAPSPLFKSRKPAFLDSRQLTQGTTNHTKKDGLSLFSGLKSKSDPMSKSSLCINGSHVYMEETTTKDKTPTSSPSPHNLRRKQLFASEENLSSRSTKSPEEMGRTSPGQAFSGSTSLETFKSMTLPSYKLLSSEEHLDTSVPPSIEPVRETKKPDHKKSALLTLVTGKKEMLKPSDAEIIPDRTLQSEENTILEEKSEEEAKCPEGPADLGRGSPSGDAHHVEEAITTKQVLSPCEEEQKPEKAAPAKTKAVKPSPCQPHSSSRSLLSDTPSRRAESPKKPRAEGFADKAGNSGKKKLLQARVSPSETFPNHTPRGAETVSPQHRLHPVKPMNAMANKPQSKNLNVISTMNEKLLEMSVKKYDPSDPAYAYAQLTHDELIQLVLKQKDTITRKDLQVRELEDYIDNLLVRVMEETPNILRVSISGNKKAGKM